MISLVWHALVDDAGCKLFTSIPDNCSKSFKFVSLVLQCTGGGKSRKKSHSIQLHMHITFAFVVTGILVPIFINAIPVPLSNDAYPICIICSFLLHQYFPILREVWKLSPVFKAGVIVLYEALRASVVVKLTSAAGKAIAPSEFSFALFGPIFCGTIGGCGGAFLPLNKGLDPIKELGLGQPMLSAFVAATFYHIFLNTSLSVGVIRADDKAHVLIAAYFIAYNLSVTLLDGAAVKVSHPIMPSEGKNGGESKKLK
jgi:hypothetical protein